MIGETMPLREFMWWDVRSVSRANVREPVSPHIRVVLYDPETRSSDVSVLLTVPQALHAIEQLSRQLGQHIQRADIRRAMANTDPGPCNQALGLAETASRDLDLPPANPSSERGEERSSD